MSDDLWPEIFRSPELPWYWWWREGKHSKMLELTTWGGKESWERDVQLSAFRYELMRRFDRKKRTYHYRKTDFFARTLLGPISNGQLPILRLANHKQKPNAAYIELPPISFCKTSAKGNILEAIAKLIDEKCQEHDIKLPKTAPKGKQNRPPSWRWLELLDRKDVLGESKFNDNDRAKISNARKQAKELSQVFWKLLIEEYQNNSQE